MKSRERWQPSKYVYKKGKLVASRDRNEVGVGSRLVADLVAERYEESFQQHAKGRLLDLGCGKVPFFAAYENYIIENICVDWANTLHKNEYLDYECDLTQALPFVDEEFNTIVLSDVLEHIPEPEALWKEMSRVLSQDGKLIMNVPFFYRIHEKPHDYYRYTEFALRRYVEASGMRIIQLSAIGGAPEIMTDVFAKNILHIPKIGPSLAAFAQWMTSAFVKTRLGRKLSEATSKNFPFGYFLVAEKPRR